MSAAYVTVSCDRGEVRKFGGNRNVVRGMRDRYRTMSKEEFFTMHPYLTEEDYNSLKVSFRRKNR